MKSLHGAKVWMAAAMLLLGVATPAIAEDPIPAGATITPDPAVKRGTMANGLRYAIMRNGVPAGGVSIRLAFNVGSYEEAENERGAAHFIEHMAFRSTRYAPDGILDNRFAAFGVALGRHQNAVTGLDRTMYSVDLPTSRPEGIKTTLEWMRSAADGILFTPAAVQVERGVVLAEKEARNSPIAAMQEEVQRFQGANLRSANRDPSGTDTSLQTLTPGILKAFHERWYRPENAMLVIVGDLSVEDLERAATAAFSSWTGKGKPGIRAQGPAPDPNRGLEAFSRSSPSLPSALSACRLSGPAVKESGHLQRLRRELYSHIWTGVLNRRLARMAARPGSPLLNASAGVSRDGVDAVVTCLSVMPTNNDWRSALAATQAELRRLGDAGPTETEVTETIENFRSAFRAQLTTGATRPSGGIANDLANSHLTGRVFQTPQEAMRSFNTAASGINAADVKRIIAQDWAGNGPLLIATAPAAPSRDELLAAWRANEKAAPLEAYADRGTSAWLYDNFGPAGQVRKRETIADGAFQRFHFSNGTILNFKNTQFQSNMVEIRVRFGHGERGLDSKTRAPVGLAAGFFPSGGLGKMDLEDIASAFTNSTWNFDLEVEPSAYVLNSSTLSNQIYRQMQLLAAFMTDPGFRPEMDDKLPTAVDLVYRRYPTDPHSAALHAMENVLHPGKQSLPPREEMTAYTAKDFERMLKPVLTRSPIEVTIVGDLPERDALAAVAGTFGAFPERPALAPPPEGEGPFRRYPAVLPPPVRTTHQGPREKAAAILLWPLYVASPQRRSEEFAIGLLSTIFQTRLLQRVRGEMGKVYSPSVGDMMPDAADQGYLSASIEATPADLDEMVAITRQIAADLVAGKISQQEVDEARAPLIAERQQALEHNAPWAGLIAHTVRHPEALDELLRYEQMMNALTLSDVRKAAATWLSREPMVSIAMPAGVSRP